MGMSDIKGARGLGCNIVAIAKQHTAVCLAAATLRAMNLKSARRTRTFTQSHHDLINKSMHARRLCRYTWERATHVITFILFALSLEDFYYYYAYISIRIDIYIYV